VRLDHVVIAVADLEATVADYRELGFTVVIGGRHPGRTSHNALVVFADGSYLELIAWHAPGPAERWYREHQRHGDGFMDFALWPEDTAAVVAAAGARGLALAGPLDGGRLRPDGVEIRWRTGRPSTFDLPFLCGDVTPRDLRVPPGEARIHPNGVLGVAALTVAVRDVEASLARYAALLGEPAARAVPAAIPETGLRAAIVPLEGGALVLATPALESAPAGEPAAARRVRARLAGAGEGPCALALRSAAPDGRALDPRLAHGAHLEVALAG